MWSWERDCRGVPGFLVGFGECLVEFAETVRPLHQVLARRIIETVNLVPDAPARPIGVPSIVLAILQAENFTEDPQIMWYRKAVSAVLMAEEVEEIVEACPSDRGQAQGTRLVCRQEDQFIRFGAFLQLVEALQTLNLAVPERIGSLVVCVRQDQAQVRFPQKRGTENFVAVGDTLRRQWYDFVFNRLEESGKKLNSIPWKFERSTLGHIAFRSHPNLTAQHMPVIHDHAE